MKNFFADLSMNNKLGLFAFVLGFLALFAGSPYHGSEATVNAKELALIVEKEVDHVSVEFLRRCLEELEHGVFRRLFCCIARNIRETRYPGADILGRCLRICR